MQTKRRGRDGKRDERERETWLFYYGSSECFGFPISQDPIWFTAALLVGPTILPFFSLLWCGGVNVRAPLQSQKKSTLLPFVIYWIRVVILRFDPFTRLSVIQMFCPPTTAVYFLEFIHLLFSNKIKVTS